MKFLFADTADTVDPSFDFERTRSLKQRRVHDDDEYPHEHLERAPYDGILLSRAAFSDHLRSGKYGAARSMRFRREGARVFLRYPEEKYAGSIVMGDCGAFSYRDAEFPLYSVDDTLGFYADGGFTHGCSVDHLIFDFEEDDRTPSDEAKRRQEITLTLASEFFETSPALGRAFTPVGVIQGWSAQSMADAAADLVKMGYRSLALGGMARSPTGDIERALHAITERIGLSRVAIHVLGFGKVEDAPRLARMGVTSFDTTSPLLRAFKDDRQNYFETDGERLGHYTAIRIPQASDDRHARASARARAIGQEELIRLENIALTAARGFAAGHGDLEAVVDRILDYASIILWKDKRSEKSNLNDFAKLRAIYLRSLGERPWERCSCRVCSELGVEALIFRSTNHNKRRGFHNLAVFHELLRSQSKVAL